jgi:hypothetical protein
MSLPKIMTLRDVAVEVVKRLQHERHPDGFFLKNGVYRLADEEYCICCQKHHFSNEEFPHMLSSHARTVEHVANRFSVDAKELRKEIKKYRKTLKK